MPNLGTCVRQYSVYCKERFFAKAPAEAVTSKVRAMLAHSEVLPP